MSCETAHQEYIVALKALVAATTRLLDFQLALMGSPHAEPLPWGPDSETAIQIQEEAAAADRVKREKETTWKERAALHQAR